MMKQMIRIAENEVNSVGVRIEKKSPTKLSGIARLNSNNNIKHTSTRTAEPL
ncbi:Uncharacterised protein [Candidatus Bilamarchaeum dharawalense]|uniref:Uncharacterized protein n=1 Tax=Candidatus Bilamarchaeum dharawalense TaxID=2885759 RepID=A0A5E4LTI0_9ARCH|nr:Uncharacterised protein [Candidatus Bilamarchaeum dharawalense]